MCFCGSAPPGGHPISAIRSAETALQYLETTGDVFLVTLIPCIHICFGVLRALSSGKLEIKRSVLVHAYRCPKLLYLRPVVPEVCCSDPKVSATSSGGTNGYISVLDALKFIIF